MTLFGLQFSYCCAELGFLGTVLEKKSAPLVTYRFSNQGEANPNPRSAIDTNLIPNNLKGALGTKLVQDNQKVIGFTRFKRVLGCIQKKTSLLELQFRSKFWVYFNDAGMILMSKLTRMTGFHLIQDNQRGALVPTTKLIQENQKERGFTKV